MRPALILVPLLLLGLAEAGARAAEPYLYDPGMPGSVTLKMDQIESLDLRPDVVFTGSSIVADGIDPEVFDATASDGVESYNAAFDGGNLPLMDDWLGHVVLPRLRPRTVVLGLSSFDLNDRPTVDVERLRRIIRPSPTSRVLDEIGARLEPHSALLRLRPTLRNPAAVGAATRRLREPGPPETRLGPRGGVARADPTYRGAEVAEILRNGALSEFAVGGYGSDVLRDVVADLRGGAIEVVVVNMPVTDDFFDAHPDGVRDYRAYVAELRSSGRDLGLRLVDAADWFDNRSLYADTHHLNVDGMRAFSRRLADVLR